MLLCVLDDDAAAVDAGVAGADVPWVPFFGVVGAEPDNLFSIDFDLDTFSVGRLALSLLSSVALSFLVASVTLSCTVFSGFAMAWSRRSTPLPFTSSPCSVGSSVPSDSAAAAVAVCHLLQASTACNHGTT